MSPRQEKSSVEATDADFGTSPMYKPDPRKIMFEQLKKGLGDKFGGDQPKLDALAAINPHQARILNPLSHDPTTSLNEAEVIAAIDAIEAIEAIEALMPALRI